MRRAWATRIVAMICGVVGAACQIATGAFGYGFRDEVPAETGSEFRFDSGPIFPRFDGGFDGRGADAGLAADVHDPVSVLAPRPIAPLSMMRVTTRHPTLRWALGEGSDGAHVQLCADRRCSTVIAETDALGSSITIAATLPAGAVFWQLRGVSGNTAGWSSNGIWEFFVPPDDHGRGSIAAPLIDVNGDGTPDAIVGAPGCQAATGDCAAGRAAVYLGTRSGLVETTPTAVLSRSDEPLGAFGFAVASAADVNGDGFGDVVVGAPHAQNEGRAFLFLGGPVGAELAAIPLPPPAGFTGTMYGVSVAGLGDIDGDGYGDVAVGATFATVDGDPYRGAVYVFRGGPDDVWSHPTVVIAGPDGPGGTFGTVHATGDVNGDGIADFVVGAPCAPGAIGDAGLPVCGGGRAYVYLGTPGIVPVVPSVMLPGPPAGDAGFGGPIASGDFNADGLQDLAIGAPLDFDSQGAAFVYVATADGFAMAPSLTIRAQVSLSTGFAVSMAGNGDVNGDGIDDLIIGSPCDVRDMSTRCGAGREYLFYGSSAGLRATSTTSVDGTEVASRFGDASSIVGDLDDDGIGDFVVGAPCDHHGIADGDCGGGVAYVFNGFADGRVAGVSGLAGLPGDSFAAALP